VKFLAVDTIQNARQQLLEQTTNWILKPEIVSLQNALGRVIFEDIISEEDIPSFRRSTVDGYAVVCKDTQAAGDALPAFLNFLGSVEIGEATDIKVASGTCCEVPTGGMLPEGADAVVMLEYCENFGDDGIAVYKSISNGENVVNAGDDITVGKILLRSGNVLRPQDIGALAAAGKQYVTVFAAPRLSLISTGDELAALNEDAIFGKVRDVNSYALAALAEKNGFSVISSEVLPDDEKLLTYSIQKAMLLSDIIIISGGSSVGKKDNTAKIIDKIASEGVNTHGLALKPGKPTILGYDALSKTVLAGLPGHPVSAFIVFELLFGWLIKELSGASEKAALPARLTHNIAASPGKLTCCLCKLTWVNDCYEAEPVLYKSGLITSLTVADGYFLIEKDIEGFVAGQIVLVTLL